MAVKERRGSGQALVPRTPTAMLQLERPLFARGHCYSGRLTRPRERTVIPLRERHDRILRTPAEMLEKLSFRHTRNSGLIPRPRRTSCDARLALYGFHRRRPISEHSFFGRGSIEGGVSSDILGLFTQASGGSTVSDSYISWIISLSERMVADADRNSSLRKSILHAA